MQALIGESTVQKGRQSFIIYPCFQNVLEIRITNSICSRVSQPRSGAKRGKNKTRTGILAHGCKCGCEACVAIQKALQRSLMFCGC